MEKDHYRRNCYKGEYVVYKLEKDFFQRKEYLFLMSAEDSIIEFIALVVESDIKVNSVLPRIR